MSHYGNDDSTAGTGGHNLAVERRVPPVTAGAPTSRPDSTDVKVRRIVTEGFASAYDGRLRQADDGPDCGCGHGQSAHHGPNGELRCGEGGCRCAAFHDPYPAPCPDCITGTWDDVAGRCIACGLTIETLAERSSE